jgi:hypothetical protein
LNDKEYLFRHYLGIRDLLCKSDTNFYTKDKVPQALFIQDVVRVSYASYNVPCTASDTVKVSHNNVYFGGNIGFLASYLMYNYKWCAFSDIFELLIKISNIAIPIFSAYRSGSVLPLALILVIYSVFKNYKYDTYGIFIATLGYLIWYMDPLIFINFIQHLIYVILLKDGEAFETDIYNKG